MIESNAKYPFNIVENIDTMLDDLEAEIQKLPLNSTVKANIVNHIYKMYAEIEDCMEATPTDWA